MSVDVFGRKLSSSKGSRGPPGIGYKITRDGQYDLENKKLCNLASPTNPHDAVNLSTLQEIIKTELKTIQEIISELKKRLNDLDMIEHAFEEKVNQQWIDLKSIISVHQSANTLKFKSIQSDVEYLKEGVSKIIENDTI